MDYPQTRKLIARHEGLRLKPYRDTRGNISIGYGYNLTANGITQAQADDWLDDMMADLFRELSAAYPWFITLSASRQGALLDLAYNTGLEGFAEFKRMIAALEEDNYAKAADEILDSTLATGRKRELATIMRKGDWA